MLDKKWLHSREEMLRSLLGDEAKNKAMLVEMENTLRQLRAKCSFRLALINALIEEQFKSEENK